MAPSVVRNPHTPTPVSASEEIRVQKAYDEAVHESYTYADYLPVYDNTSTFPPVEPFEFVDRGTLADKAKPHLFNTGNPNVLIAKLAPRIGTEIKGLQLSQLNDTQKNELALLIAERGVVVFRDQDFKDIGPQKQKDFGRYFGPLHINHIGAHVKGHIELHQVYLGADNRYRLHEKSKRLTATNWHSDISFEHQPPGITILTMLHLPDVGGDTAWVSQAAAYERLSPPIQKLLEGLRAVHEYPNVESAMRDGMHVRVKPVISRHPIVRVHPVTGEKSLFVNKGFAKKIEGLQEEESDALLHLLFQHIMAGQDFQCRVKWEEGTVMLWDNRSTAHTALPDYSGSDFEEGFRHGFRIATMAEKPVGVDGLESIW